MNDERTHMQEGRWKAKKKRKHGRPRGHKRVWTAMFIPKKTADDARG